MYDHTNNYNERNINTIIEEYNHLLTLTVDRAKNGIQSLWKGATTTELNAK